MPKKDFTEREKEILDLVADGLDRQEMADFLGISKDTIDTHKKNIHFKAGTTHLAQLIVFAISKGFGRKNKKK